VSGPTQRLARFDPFARADAEETEDGALRYVLLDVFAERPLAGNQLAVFAPAGDVPAATMQTLACELRLSESIFLFPAQGEGDARARIFTPASELPFAGHPVLGAGALLAAALDRASVVLETGAGPVAVELQAADGRAMSAAMAQPVPTWEPVADPGPLLDALGLASSSLPVERYTNGPAHILVTADSPARVAALDPDLRALEALAGATLVSCFAGGEGSFKTRMFAPGLGVAEDPATGSAAGPLAVHAVRHGLAAPGERLAIRQGAELGRPSLLLVRAEGRDGRFERVEVAGGVVAVGRGELRPG
jgi:trans-2,3-dihydro-3-hydroxyanthranilate isomerase